jgi:DNA-binding cell septation regulator SpoVG
LTKIRYFFRLPDAQKYWDTQMFVAMPNEKINDKYKDICHPISNEARQKIIDVVMEAYEQFQAKSSG